MIPPYDPFYPLYRPERQTLKPAPRPRMRALCNVTILISLLMMGVFAAQASPLVSFRSGQEFRLESRLESGRVLIFWEAHCQHCHRYIKNILSCPPELQARLDYISLSTARLTEKLSQAGVPTSQIYLLKNKDKKWPFLQGTPTTKTRQDQRTGVLNCQELQNLSKTPLVSKPDTTHASK